MQFLHSQEANKVNFNGICFPKGQSSYTAIQQMVIIVSLKYII